MAPDTNSAVVPLASTVEPQDPKSIHLANISIDMMTEAFATVQIPAQIGHKQQSILQCKIDIDAGGNVMPLHAFTKLFPKRVSHDGKPTSLYPCRTHLTAYNGTDTPQLDALDSSIM